MIKVEYTQQEAQALVQLIDMACKAGGMAVAEACIALTKKIIEATKEQAPPSLGEPNAAPQP